MGGTQNNSQGDAMFQIQGCMELARHIDGKDPFLNGLSIDVKHHQVRTRELKERRDSSCDRCAVFSARRQAYLITFSFLFPNTAVSRSTHPPLLPPSSFIPPLTTSLFLLSPSSFLLHHSPFVFPPSSRSSGSGLTATSSDAFTPPRSMTATSSTPTSVPVPTISHALGHCVSEAFTRLTKRGGASTSSLMTRLR